MSTVVSGCETLQPRAEDGLCRHADWPGAELNISSLRKIPGSHELWHPSSAIWEQDVIGEDRFRKTKADSILGLAAGPIMLRFSMKEASSSSMGADDLLSSTGQFDQLSSFMREVKNGIREQYLRAAYSHSSQRRGRNNEGAGCRSCPHQRNKIDPASSQGSDQTSHPY